MKKHYLIYQITNRINGKIYIGKHITTNIDDDYFGSGKVLKRAQNKYGLENFIKTILFECQNEIEMNLLEKCVVTLEFCKRKDVYNIKEGGEGGWDYINSQKLNIGFEYANKHKLNNKCNQCYKAAEKIKTDPEYAVQFSRKISNGIKKHKLEHPEFSAGENNPMFGKHHSDTAKQKISESRKGDKNWAFGKHWYHDKYGNRKMFYPKDVPDGWFRKMR